MNQKTSEASPATAEASPKPLEIFPGSRIPCTQVCVGTGLKFARILLSHAAFNVFMDEEPCVCCPTFDPCRSLNQVLGTNKATAAVV